VLVAMIVLGLGVGSGLAVYTVVVQNAMPQKLGQASSALVFFRQLGGTIGLAAMGSVLSSTYIPAFHSALSSTLMQVLPARVLAIFENPLVVLSPGALTQVRTGFVAFGGQGVAAYDALIEAVKTGLAQSVHNVFLLSLGLMISGLVAVFFLKEIPLRDRRSASTTAPVPAETGKSAAQIAD